ncbi:hypothetical protein VNI00_015760 [Paramarasmius palmivorus]|uniref:Transcription activator GCR1-like domain-containing protein n=1 Tax=Paramarasmius palmivorus TaxID=297713 RepID=A0AAW0BIX9_9AGAR
MVSIEKRLGADKVRQHSWYWDVQQEDWSPRWRIELGISRDEMCTEYYTGLNSAIPIKDLDERWRHHFWGQQQQRSEFTRRKRMFRLIDRLKEEKEWTHEKSLQFLRDCYPISREARERHLRTASQFIRWLRDENVETIMARAAEYA